MEQQNKDNLVLNVFTIRGAITGLIAYLIVGGIIATIFV